MQNKLCAFANRYAMLQPGDRVVCAVSGGADSMALLWAFYLLKEKLQITLTAAHFNHHLRGAESDRDEEFVKTFCHDYGIDFVSGSGQVVAGSKGLEAAAREARYSFLRSLPGKIATAHTADDNAETLLMHLVRGTGLKGLGGITPVNGPLIRPMLEITRTEVLAFLEEYSIPFVEDSSNGGDDFLRNRLRHHVMPLLKQENPVLSQNLSAMAQRLRQDEAALEAVARERNTNRVSELRNLEPGIRSRILTQMLLDAGVREPEAAHIRALEKLLQSQRPSAKAFFPGGVVIARNYDTLDVCGEETEIAVQKLKCPGTTELPELGLRVLCEPNKTANYTINSFAVCPKGDLMIRSRLSGDTIRLSAGTKSLKKLFIDRKIPAARRGSIPVIADAVGVLAAVGIGANLERISQGPDAIRISIEYL